MRPTSPSSPPTCASIRSPSIVCVLMIARSSASSGPGLLMISGGIRDLADVVHERHELRVAPLAGREAELVGDAEHQVDDIAGGQDHGLQRLRSWSRLGAHLERQVDGGVQPAASDRGLDLGSGPADTDRQW
jgi:hypothetical protein